MDLEYLFLVAKVVHIVGVVSWFAGMFYLVRMFVYYAEATENPNPVEQEILMKQFGLMQKRAYNIISTPASIITYIGGISMLAIHTDLLSQGWMHVKLLFVVGITAYHIHSGFLMKSMQRGTAKGWTSDRLRLWNEVATIFLVAIVMLVVFRNLLNALYAFVAIIGLMIFLMVGIKAYKRSRQNNRSV